MRLKYSKTALKQLKKLPKSKKYKILEKTLLLQKYPYTGKKLGGELKEFQSLKVWPYRIIYQIKRKESLVFVNFIQHRQPGSLKGKIKIGKDFNTLPDDIATSFGIK